MFRYFRWTYVSDTPSSIELLDDYYEEVEALVEPLKVGQLTPIDIDVQVSDPANENAGSQSEQQTSRWRSVLNKRVYFIWKMPTYCTSYHQDTHVMPHFTL